MTEHSRVVALSTLQGWDRNPRKHPEKQIAALAGVIRRFGLTNLPILAIHPGNPEGFINAGNGRLAALRLLHQQSPKNPPVGVDVDGDDWLIPVRPVAFVSRNEAEAAALSDNWVAEMEGVEDDAEILRGLLAELDADGTPLDGLGVEDVAALLGDQPTEADWGDALGGLPDSDRAPIQQMTFTLHDDQAATVKEAMERAKGMGDFGETGNENSNGNALARVCEMFLGGAR